ncbi:MAG TPA: hypothetical protein VGB83_10985 [Actinomycetota bacterium]
MGSPRLTLAIGSAAAAGAIAMLSGRVDGSALLAVLLVVVARAAALSVVADSGVAARATGRDHTLTLAWIGILAIAATLAETTGLAAMRELHTTDGPALAGGRPLAVVAAWLAVVAALVATGRSTRASGPVSEAPTPFSRLEALAWVLQLWLVVALFIGPNVGAWRDAVPWAAGIVGLGALGLLARPWLRWEVVDRLAVALAGAGLILASIGGPA